MLILNVLLNHNSSCHGKPSKETGPYKVQYQKHEPSGFCFYLKALKRRYFKNIPSLFKISGKDDIQ